MKKNPNKTIYFPYGKSSRILSETILYQIFGVRFVEYQYKDYKVYEVHYRSGLFFPKWKTFVDLDGHYFDMSYENAFNRFQYVLTVKTLFGIKKLSKSANRKNKLNGHS